MKCPYHRSDFCTHGGQTVTTEAEPTAPVIRCACGKPATVTTTVLPRPLPLFGSAVRAPRCPACHLEAVKGGVVLGPTERVGEGIS
jgi:hypothetical protein